MSDLETLQAQVLRFRDERDWKRFHRPKDLAISLNLEAAEVLECFQWKAADDTIDRARLGAELSDVLYWVLLLASEMDIDLASAFEAKMRQNAVQYPVDRAKGSSRKYTEL